MSLRSKQKEHQIYYIGFHATTFERVVSIAHSKFLLNRTRWLDAEACFVRSVKRTINKARCRKGTWFIFDADLCDYTFITQNGTLIMILVI